jgi:hypothetical protein
MRSLLTLAALATLMAATAPAHAGSNSCANFNALDNGTELAEKFRIKGFRFKDRAGGVVPVVHNATGANGQTLHGATFDPRSLVITFPESHADDTVATVRLLVAPGTTVRLRALNSQGATVQNVLAHNENVYDVVLQAPPGQTIASVVADGGGGQSTLGQVCGAP